MTASANLTTFRALSMKAVITRTFTNLHGASLGIPLAVFIGLGLSLGVVVAARAVRASPGMPPIPLMN